MADRTLAPLVITEVVNNDLCIGCGVCVDACPSNALDMVWNEQGFLTAEANGNACDADGVCIKVCPFNPEPEKQYENEDKLAEMFLTETNTYHPKIGRYERIFAGYSKKYRETSSSGGVATYIYDRLFEKGLIDHVVTVRESEDGRREHYSYSIISGKDQLLSTSKTRYYPVTLAHTLEDIKALDGYVAISGVACFVKAVRLAQAHDLILKDKIVFLVGIICGGVKSSFFTEYLASRAGIDGNNFLRPEYRVKDPQSTASDYGFSCESIESKRTNFIKMREVGDMWGSGLFKANACDFCDDVTTELADVSLGDAWLDPYNRDGKGHNVIVTRNPVATEILQEGQNTGDIILESLALDKFLLSQQGSFNHRHDGLALRCELAKNAGKKVPPKRHDTVRLPLYLRFVQLARRKSRAKSLKAWQKHRDAIKFDREMKLTTIRLRIVTRLSHWIKKLKRMVNKKR